MEIRFTKEDFKNLKSIRQSNKEKYSINLKYPNKKIRNLIRTIQKPVWNKMNDLIKHLKDDSYFFKRFHSGICTPAKQTNQFREGFFREEIWIYLVDKTSYHNSEGKYRHLRLPQIQCTINPEGLTIASIWLEAQTILKKYRDNISKFLDENKIGNEYSFVVYDKEIEKRIYYGSFYELRADKKIEYLENKKYSIGIDKFLKKNEAINHEGDMYEYIVSEIQDLVKRIYIPAFRFKMVDFNTKKELNERYRRKGRGLYEIKNIIRKGIPERKVNTKHRIIQNALYNYLVMKFNEKPIILEEDFVDLKLGFKKQKKLILYEIKTMKSALECIKSGLGQLLFYAMINKEIENVELVIVGTEKLTMKGKEFVKEIKGYLGRNNFRYQMFDEKKNILLNESKS